MSFNRYYREELEYLRSLGQLFAEENPQLARFVGEQGNDPDVERLMEGFAFIAGRLRQKIEDEFPELTHDLMSLVWPNYLRPIPCMSILEFTPIEGTVQRSIDIPKAAEVASNPVDGTNCTFRTAYPVTLDPLCITACDAQAAGTGTMMVMKLRTLPGVSLSAITTRSFRFFINAEPLLADSYYLWLLEKLAILELRDPVTNRIVARLEPDSIRSAGLSEEESLLPFPENAFAGYRLFQEFFAFKEKYHFVWLDDLPLEQLSHAAGGFDLIFRFSVPFDDIMRPKAGTFRLHCTPIANIFDFDGDPLRIDQRFVEYRIRPASRQPLHYEIFSIDQVEGWVQGSGQHRIYRPFEAFEHNEDVQGRGKAVYYRRRLKPSAIGQGVDHFLAFVDASDRTSMPPTETISIKLQCTNRNLPEKLGIGDISLSTSNSPEFAEFNNITRVSESLRPPIQGRSAWTLISNLSLNYRTLANVEALRVVLSAYDFRAAVDKHASRQRKVQLEGIVNVRSEKVDRLYRGLPVRGIRSSIDLREENFGGEGSAYVFANTLAHFLAHYASVNSFHELEIFGTDHGETYRWPPMIGERVIL